MRFRIQDTVLSVSLRDEPRPNASASAGTIIGTDLLEKLADAAEPDWWRVRVVTPGAPEREGFIRSILLTEAGPDEPSQDIDKEAFFSQIAFAAQRFGANRDYLYAVAVVESGVKNINSLSSSAVGPFQFMQDTWDGLVRDHGAETGVNAADIADPGAQATFAAILSSDAQARLEQSLGHVPSGAQLYCAHLLGIGAAASVLAVDPTTPIDAPLRQFYSGTPRGAGFADKIIAANSGLLAGRSVEQVLDAMAAQLGPGLDEATQIATTLGFTVDQMPPGTSPGEEPPWLAVARQQLAMNIVEDKTPGGSNPEIEKFFTATSLGAARDDTAWCGAFVSWCMAHSGNAKVEAGNRRSARAADWREWGVSIDKPTVGAVAVLRPLVPKSSGHVGFVTGEDGGRIELLGGNQHDSLCKEKFSKADVVRYRWLDWN